MKAVEAESFRQSEGDLVNAWYVAGTLKDFKARAKRGLPFASEVYGYPLALFEDAQGQIACVLDRCLHRHAKLSEGEVKNSCIVCPYHGWAYAADGRVAKVPSDGDSQKASRIPSRVRSFPVIVQDDLIWVWTGEVEKATETLPFRFPHYGEPGWTNYFMVTDFEGNVTQLAENFMDVPHTIFVHKGWFRSESRKAIPIRVETKESEVLVTYEQPQDEIGFSHILLNPKRKPMFHTDRFIMPNVTRVDYEFGDTSAFVICSQMTPLAPMKTRVYTQIGFMFRWMPVWMQEASQIWLRNYTRKVIEQDVDIMANVAKSYRHDSRESFHHTDADRLHVEIERLRLLGKRSLKSAMKPKCDVRKEIWI